MRVTPLRILSAVFILTAVVYIYETMIVNYNSLIFMYQGVNLNSLTDYMVTSGALLAAGIVMLITDKINSLRSK